MPELPEVETTLRGIFPYVCNASIEAVIVRNASLRWPVPTAKLETLVGHSIETIERRAKYLLVVTAAGTILLHLGMSGSLRVLDKSIEPGKHDHIDIVLSNSKILRLNDPRRFGCCLFLKPGDNARSSHKLLASLGPEPLDKTFTGEHLFELSRKRSIAIKNFIMDGKVVVGVGNIYASESLYQAGIRPTAQAGKISRARYDLLALAIKAVLAKAIEAGGTTLNDFSQADGQPGYFQQELKVYGRDGQKCFECSTELKSMIVGQRNTFYCRQCQTF